MSPTIFLTVLSVAALLLAPSATANTDIPLGACTAFALEAGTAITFNGQLTIINTGDVGVAPGNSITGSYKVSDGSVQVDTSSSIQCHVDLQHAYNVSMTPKCPPASIYAELSGLTLAPGVYCSDNGMKFSSSTLTLNGQGDPNAQWIFQVGTALTTGSSTSFILENGAQAMNVFWAVGTSVTLGASSSFVGNLFAQTAVGFLTEAEIIGRALALTAISFASGSSVTLPTEAASSRRLSVPLSLGDCTNFAVLAGTSLNFNGAKTVVQTGSIGVSPGSNIGGSYEVDAGTEEHNTAIAKSCAANIQTLYNQASNAMCTANHTLQNSDLAGVILTPGVYCSAIGKFVFSASTLTLDAQGNPDAQWVFQTATTLTTATATSFKLINGAQSTNVYWAIGTSATLGYSSNFVGTILAQGAVTYGSSTNIVGRGLAQTAITFASGGVINLPSN